MHARPTIHVAVALLITFAAACPRAAEAQLPIKQAIQPAAQKTGKPVRQFAPRHLRTNWSTPPAPTPTNEPALPDVAQVAFEQEEPIVDPPSVIGEDALPYYLDLSGMEGGSFLADLILTYDEADVIHRRLIEENLTLVRSLDGGLTWSELDASLDTHADTLVVEGLTALGIAVGSGYLFPTTFEKEVHSDLTGERGVLMGALAGIMEAQYNLLRKHGHSPSEAFNETVEELTQSLIRLVGQHGMDWMYANCSTTAQRGALDWRHRFREAVTPIFEELYPRVVSGEETRIVLKANSGPDYKERLEIELKEMRESEMWRAGAAVRSLRPENWGNGTG